MFFSSRHIQEMRDAFLAISAGQWACLACGLILSACLWVLINRRVVRQITATLKERGLKSNPVALFESALGAVILLVNGGLLYLATLVISYFLFAFAVTGLVVGAWVFMPADNG